MMIDTKEMTAEHAKYVYICNTTGYGDLVDMWHEDCPWCHKVVMTGCIPDADSWEVLEDYLKRPVSLETWKAVEEVLYREFDLTCMDLQETLGSMIADELERRKIHIMKLDCETKEVSVDVSDTSFKDARTIEQIIFSNTGRDYKVNIVKE